MAKARILVFSGSLRRGSFNRLLALEAARGAEAVGASVTAIELAQHPLPLFSEDDEAATGLHPNARALKDLFLAHDGLIIGCPEYNSGITAALKNAIDWVSRPCVQPDGSKEAPLACFANKAAGLVAASPGALGGIRGLPMVRTILQNIRVTVVPEMLAVGTAHEAFDGEGRLKDAGKRELAHVVGRRVAFVAAALRA